MLFVKRQNILYTGAFTSTLLCSLAACHPVQGGVALAGGVDAGAGAGAADDDDDMVGAAAASGDAALAPAPAPAPAASSCKFGGIACLTARAMSSSNSAVYAPSVTSRPFRVLNH